MKKPFVAACLPAVLAMLTAQARALPQPPSAPPGFNPFEETREAYDARAQWLRDAKFGVFLHWTPSVLCGGEVSWIMRQDMGDMPKVDKDLYMNLPKRFNPKNFDARQWVKLFEDAGIRYAVVVPKHHDGFAMWDTQVDPGIPDWTIMKTPWRRDYVREMAEACDGSKVRFCLYYSILDWVNPRYKPNPGADLTAYKEEVFKPHMKELLTRYGNVGCIWFDGHWDASWTHENGKEMYGYMRQLQPGTLLGNRIDAKSNGGPVCAWTGSFWHGPDPVGDYQAREMDTGEFYMEKAWDNCYNLRQNPCGSWSWIKDQYNWPVRTRDDVLTKFIDCLGRDGGLLLGVGPREDGTIDPDDAAALRVIGQWMEQHAEAVYGTRGGPWKPGPWGVSTRKGDKVFLFIQNLPENGTLELPALKAKVKAARMLTSGAPLEMAEKEDGAWSLHIPRGRRSFGPAAVVELVLDRTAMTLPAIPSTEALVALAQGMPVEVSSVWEGRPQLAARNITDGSEQNIWAAAEKERSAVATVDLKGEHTLHQVMFSDAPYRRTRGYTIEVFSGGKWTKVGEGTETNFSGQAEVKLAGVKASKVRVTIKNATDTPVIAEIRATGK
jgi:alpha-L-fucosidase